MIGEPGGTVTLRTSRCVADAMIHHPKTFSPEATVGDVAAFLLDEHVHAALVVDDARLLSVVERADLATIGSIGRLTAKAESLGILAGRTVAAEEPLGVVWRRMRSAGRRRLAVIDPEANLLGLLCVKRSGFGFCSDGDVAARAAG